MIFQLNDHDITFPPPELADDDGLLATGGDLSVSRLLAAYQQGIFPWYAAGGPICWYAPRERFVLYPTQINTSKSMKKIVASGAFSITFNKAFEAVINNCSILPRKGQDGTWITDEMKAAYIRLHAAGYAHSVETWKNGTLAGGLYGVQINRVFCGESMFSNSDNASKAALIWLSKREDIKLIDCQVYTSHLESMGAAFISAAEFIRELQPGDE